MTLQIKKQLPRESNIELLLIILMLMIIDFHLIVHGARIGGPTSNYPVDESSLAYLMLKSFLVIAVDSFVFISGYYRINFRIKPFLSIILQTTFYSLAITLVADTFTSTYLSPTDYVKAFVPYVSNTWWFITAYLGLYLLSPLLNIAIDALTVQII